ncbi:Ig-like domain-containing protein [Lacticaseibacillus brantae]|uniref:BIG2 domain-containing protein n=1 Tax=Lacticaseibacillus brantae DSM 23927 TaxID=1423727 RepID=A0A0R2AYU1_9LACO|nr:Ig-like domain-containing protein [Lacticaseibacillus brantae]KRM72247.1 hypothetical protein FC34_GL001232 [Lacticaseibacillus brantae DSM 23927]
MRRFLLLLTIWLGFLPATTVSAAPTYQVPSGNDFFGGGFNAEPQSQTILLGQGATITFNSWPGALIIKKSVTYTLWQQQGSGWQSILSRKYTKFDTASFTMTPQVAGTYNFQIQADWENVMKGTYYSQGFSIIVTPSIIPPTAMSLKLAHDTILPGESTRADVAFEPANATARVTWSVAPAGIVTIDSATGIITSQPNKTGLVTITATAGKLSASTQLLVGGVKDQTVAAGDPVTFELNGLHDSADYSFQWYAVDQTGNKKAIPGATHARYQFTTNPAPDLSTNPDQNRRFQVELIPNERFSGAEHGWSNVATLSLTAPRPDPGPSLNSVPEITTEPINLAAVVSQSAQLPVTATAPLAITDRGHGAGSWQLSAQLSSLETKATKLEATLNLNLGPSQVELSAGGDAVSIVQRPRGETFSTLLTGSGLAIKRNPYATAGDYQAKIKWLLTLTPPAENLQPTQKVATVKSESE